MQAEITTDNQAIAVYDRLNDIISALDIFIRDVLEPDLARWREERAMEYATKFAKSDWFRRKYEYWYKCGVEVYGNSRPNFYPIPEAFRGYTKNWHTDRLYLATKMRKEAMVINAKFRTAHGISDHPIHIILDDNELSFLTKFNDRFDALEKNPDE